MYVLECSVHPSNLLRLAIPIILLTKYGCLGRRRKIRCVFPPGNTTTCVWCLSHSSACVSQQYQVDTDGHSRNPSRNPTLEERMLRVENLLERVLDRLDAGQQRSHAEEPLEHQATVKDGIGIDVVNTASTISAPSSTSAVISIFRHASVSIHAQPLFLKRGPRTDDLLTII